MTISKYEYPGTEILINIPNIRDAQELHNFELMMTKSRVAELQLLPISGSFDLRHLQEIHRHIFQDVYPFAGKLREEDIAKDFFTFAPTQYIHSSAQSLFQQLRQEGFLKDLSADQFADRAAHYMGEINVLHPFREGNGRTQREFMRQLAQNAGYDLDWTKVPSDRIFQASVQSKSDTKGLAVVVREAITPLHESKTQLETTKDVFFRAGAYTDKRDQIHQDIVAQSLSSVRPAQEQPVVMFLGGGSAAGKSSISQMLLQSFKDANEHVLLIDSDKIKTMLPEFARLTESDPINAARQLHDESSDIATQMYEAGLGGKVNIILDGTMKNAEKYERFIQAARDNGYGISAVIADVSLEEAYRRADIRYEIEKRRVPREVIQESHRNVPITFKRIENQVDSFYLYDTTDRHPQQFYVKAHDRVMVRDDERLAQFYAKSEIVEEHLLLKDLIIQIDGMPAIFNKTVMDAKLLNSEVVSHEVRKEGAGQLLKVELKGNARKLEIQMDPVPHLSIDAKSKMLEKAAKGIRGPDPGRSLGLEL